MPDKIQIGDLLTAASLLSGFAVTALMFRIQREVGIRENGTNPTWIAWSDYLALAAILLSLIFVVLPILMWDAAAIKFAKASCAAATVAMTGFPLAALSHYRLLFGSHRDNINTPFERGEPAERVIVIVTAAIALAVFEVVRCAPH